MRCMFDPAAVARNMMRGHNVEWEENTEINLGTVLVIVVISVIIILSIIIVFIVVSHRRSSAATRAKKLSRLNAVKVIPDKVIQPEVNNCMVSGLYFFPGRSQ